MALTLTNTQDRYGVVAKTLHWLIALFVLMMLVMGLVMEDIPNGPDKFWVFGIHKSLGITILALMVARLAWKLANWHRPAPNPAHPWYERVAAESVHWGFYVLLIAMPLSGWAMTSAANSTINWFGFFPVPAITGPDPELRHTLGEAHEFIGYAIWAFLGLHVAGALKHLVIDRDDTLARMVPFMTPKRRVTGLLLAAMLAALVPFAAGAADKAPPVWTIDRASSTIGFEANQEGTPFKGIFGAFDGTITLDPATPETGHAEIIIDLNSADSQNSERDGTLKDADWFDTKTAPTATYKIVKFEKGAKEGDFLALGSLTLRGITKPLDLPFTLTTSEKDGVMRAHAVGQTSLKRLDFGLGAGQWADEGMIGNAVIVRIDVNATSKKP